MANLFLSSFQMFCVSVMCHSAECGGIKDKDTGPDPEKFRLSKF